MKKRKTNFYTFRNYFIFQWWWCFYGEHDILNEYSGWSIHDVSIVWSVAYNSARGRLRVARYLWIHWGFFCKIFTRIGKSMLWTIKIDQIQARKVMIIMENMHIKCIKYRQKRCFWYSMEENHEISFFFKLKKFS